MRIELVLIAVALAGTANAQSYREPQRAWVSGFGQGIIEATVRNNDGAELRFACPAGAEDVNPSITLTLSKSGPVDEVENLNAVFEVDGVGHEWLFDRSARENDAVEYASEAFNFRVAADQQRLADVLRHGRRLVVFVPDDHVMQTFSLVGSGEALAACAED